MKTLLIGAVFAGALTCSAIALADPIHRIENDAYWHHDSGWIFPERVGEFVREGAAQDVAGSRDAVAHYVRVFRGVRVVAAVDVFPAGPTEGTPSIEDPLEVGAGLQAARMRFASSGESPAQVVYLVAAGEWRVRISVTLPATAREVANELDAFAVGQRWETLAPHLATR